MRKQRSKSLALAITVLALSLFQVEGALGHTSVSSTTPEYKSILTEMPAEISIQFTDTLMVLGDKEVNSISLTSPSGEKIKTGLTTVSGNTVSIKLAEESYIDGTYLVDYRVVSADGHPVSGSYELYLNNPGASPVAISEEAHSEHQSFLHLHQTHIIWAGAALILILLWFGYRRFTQEQGE